VRPVITQQTRKLAKERDAALERRVSPRRESLWPNLSSPGLKATPLSLVQICPFRDTTALRPARHSTLAALRAQLSESLRGRSQHAAESVREGCPESLRYV